MSKQHDMMRAIQRRQALHARAREALAPLSRDMALSILLGWMSLDDIETRVLPAIEIALKSSGDATSSGA